jgi:SAM-dependent methyltransferase
LDFHETILTIVDRFPDLFLLIRPHPLLRSSLARSADWDSNKVEEWFKKVNLRENIFVDSNADYWPAFEASAAILADSGSFLVEYLLTEKPICHLVGRDDIGLTEEARNLACFYPGSSDSEISSFLSRVINLDDPLLESRKNALQSYFGPAIQTPSESILNEISNSIDSLPFRNRKNSLMSERHEQAYQYWRNATSTFLAPADYYERQEKELRNLLVRHGGGRFAADIGCGNGRFTEIFSDYFEFVDGTDPSEHLINEARENIIEKNISNIVYTVERLEHAESLSTYDFVSCMGVTSGLIDDDVFIKSIWKLKAAMRPGAKLLMKDTISILSSQYIDWDGYLAVYRNRSAYLESFELAGFSLLETTAIARDKENGRVNNFYLFQIA